jgi:chromosome segregation ATPase
MSKTPLTITLLCVGLLAATAFASTVAAKPGDEGRSGSDRPAAAKERMENRSAEREDRQDKMRSAHDAWQECKRDANATGNESMKERCGDEKAYFLRAAHARREAHALLGAIAALERRLGRLEAREILLEQKLESGNFTGNETAESIQQKIDQIDSHQEKMVERLQELRERLEARHAKWQSVRDEVEEHRHGADDEDDGDDEDDSEESASESSSAAA